MNAFRKKHLGVCLSLFYLAGCSEFVDPNDEQCLGNVCETLGASQCVGEQTRICVKQKGDCMVWSASIDCTAGQRCGGDGVCGTDDCTDLGVVECLGEVAVQTCIGRENGFNGWMVQACELGQKCENASCKVVECAEIGVKTCLSDGLSYAVCQEVENAFGWSSAIACDGGLECAGTGECGIHECSELGETQCIDNLSFKTCQLDESGFRKWSAAEDCLEGLICGVDNECGAHTCGPKGTKKCDSLSGGVQECTAMQGGFLGWTEPVACAEDEFCAGPGICGADQCSPLGAKACQDAFTIHECASDSAGFQVWSNPSECAGGKVCTGGVCTDPMCTSQENHCEGNIAVTCKKGFITEEPCEEGTVCQGAGNCIPKGPVAVWDQTVGSRPELTALANGGYAAIWHTNTRVWLRRFSAANVPLEPANVVVKLSLGQVQAISVAPLPFIGPEAVAVIWQEGLSDVRLRVHESVNSPGNEPIEVPGKFPYSNLSQPVGIHLGEAKLGVYRTVNLGGLGALFFSHTDGFAPMGGETNITAVGLDESFYASLAATRDIKGGAWIALTVQFKDGPFGENFPDVQLFNVNEDGEKKGELFEFKSEYGKAADASVATDSAGGVVVVYETGFDIGISSRIRGNRIGPGVGMFGAPIKINSFPSGDQRRPSITYVEGLGYWVVWQGPGSKSGKPVNRIIGRMFFETMAPLYDDRLIDGGDIEFGEEDPQTAALSDGRVVVLWRHTTDTTHWLYSRILEPTELASWPYPGEKETPEDPENNPN
jgi:hypothetical protein